MFSAFFVAMLAINLGPIGSEAAHEPQMAAKGSMVAMTFGAGSGIYFTASRDSGKTFSDPIPVAETRVLPLSRHRGPRIAFSRDAIVISAVAGRTLSKDLHAHGLPSDGDLMVWRSLDGGKSWSKGAVINDVPGAPTEGLHSLAADAQGNLFAAWLDKRSGHGTQLYGSRSTDGGVTWSKNIAIYKAPEGTICECCHPSIAMDDRGEVFIMWRNVLDGSRDFYVTSTHLTSTQDGDRFSNPQKLGNGTWKINACPMDGGGLVMDHGQLVSAWRREGQVFLAPLGKAEKQIGSGKDVAIAASPKGVYVAWSSATGLEVYTPGSTSPKPLAPAGAYVDLVALADGSVLAAWEAEGSIRTQLVKE